MKASTTKLFKNALIISIIAILVVLSGSISGLSASVKPTKLTIKPTKVTLTVGQSKTIKVSKVKPSKASKAVTYKSSNTKVATVSSKGVVKAKKAGKVTITVTSKVNKKVKAKATVTVKAKAAPVPEKKALVVYFSQGWNIVNPYKLYNDNRDDYDALAGASILKNDSGVIVGDVGVMADWIAEYLGTKTYPIHVIEVVNVKDESLEYEKTDDPGNLYPFSQRDTQKYYRTYEQPLGINPQIAAMTSHDPVLSDYDVIYLGFPNWDGEPPHAVYSFLDEHKDELNGKTIVVFASGHYRRNGFAEAQLIIKAKLPMSTVIKSSFLRGQADLSDEARDATKAELIAWVDSIRSEVNSAQAEAVSEVSGQKELAMELVGQKLTARQIEEYVGKWEMQHADTNGCFHDVASMRFYYNGFVIYTRPVGIGGDDASVIEEEITEDTLFEIMQIS